MSSARAESARRRHAGATARGAASPPGAASHVVVQFAVARSALPAAPTVRRWVDAAAARALALTVRFVGAREGRALNLRYRAKDYATNVLTFVYDDGELLTGDVVLCAPVLRREARAQGKSVTAHCAHLLVHGVLHLQGYDHDRAPAARRMERREAELLVALGYPDPYPT